MLSILAGEASAAFTDALHYIGVFDCRLCILPTLDLVTDYFLWRAEDAHCNSLNAYCYWKLKGQGKSVAEATKSLQKLSVAKKNELLFRMNINYNNLPAWQKRGIGFYWQTVYKKGYNPITKGETAVERRELLYEMELPFPDYKQWLVNLIN